MKALFSRLRQFTTAPPPPHNRLGVSLLAAALMLMSSCEKLGPLESGSPDALSSDKNPGDNLLRANEKQSKNPFSVTTMRQAYANLTTTTEPYDPATCIVCGPPTDPSDPNYPVQPTHEYVRFRPADTNQLADLDDAGLRLSWEPYDEGVAAVTTVDYNSDVIPWIYTVVPTGTELPGHIQREKIDDLYLFTPEDGDVQDAPPVDPWEPEPTPPPQPCQPVYEPSCNCWIPCAAERNGGGVTTGKNGKPNKQAEATRKLKKVKVSPRALYAEAMRISGHGDELLASGLTAPKGTQSSLTAPGLPMANNHNGRFHPAGQIRVEDTDLGAVALRRVRVESRRWFNFDQTYTDQNGNFSIGSGYLNKVKISLEFKNELATTRGIITGFRLWQSVLPISSDIGTWENRAMQTITHQVTRLAGLGNENGKAASTWAAATMFNALADAQAFSAARGMPGPAQGLNIWLFPDFPARSRPAGAAPMLRKIAETSLVSRFIDYLLVGVGAAPLIKFVLQRQLPDITIRYANDTGTMGTPVLAPLAFHELAHTQHYNQVGNNYWVEFISYIVANDGYGNKNSSGSGRIAISEGWGSYVEELYTADKYRGGSVNFRADNALDILDNQVPTDVLGAFNQGWLVYGMYHDMTDNTPEPIRTRVIDNVTAYTPATVFRGLQADVTTVRQYQARVNAQNNAVQAPQLEQLVTSYRW